MRATRRAALLLALLMASSLQAQSTLPNGTWLVRESPPELRQTIARADLIIASMHEALIQELTTALNKGGPASAIKSCHIDVISVIQRIGREEGIAAGRTSDRLRSPTNAPRRWAAPLVKANAGRRAQDVEGFAVDLGEKVGVLRPIRHRSMCASCHGAADKVSTAVRTELSERYPRDQALGFTEDEIRGWFWVEMPKKLR